MNLIEKGAKEMKKKIATTLAILACWAGIALAERRTDRACELINRARVVRYYCDRTMRIWETKLASEVDCNNPECVYIQVNDMWVNVAYMVGIATDNPEFLPESAEIK